ncbi:MAG TPA: winged helix-turn-helix transcriptional regulator [Candidatus Thermoplasmatota archaeon]|nr:winged helix-turn-helix transcriptional regulator [Candidatus Thermoplasmatota archaeon]
MRQVLNYAILGCLVFVPAVSATTFEQKDEFALDGAKATYDVSADIDPTVSAPTFATPGIWYASGYVYPSVMSWLGVLPPVDVYGAVAAEYDPQASLLNPTFDEAQLIADDATETVVEAAPEPIEPVATEAQQAANSETDGALDEGAGAAAASHASNDGVEGTVSAQAGSHSTSQSTTVSSSEALTTIVTEPRQRHQSGPAAAPPEDEAAPEEESSSGVAIPGAIAPAYAEVVGDMDPVMAALTTATVVFGTTGAAFVFVPGWRTAAWKLARRIGGLLLFSRIAQSDILNHERRSFLLEFVKQNPGERVEVARRALGFSNGSMHYHLRVLQARDLVRVHKMGGCARLFVAGPRVQPTPYVPARRKKFLEIVGSSPGLTQRDVAKMLDLSERMVSYHVRTLESQGLLEIHADGFRKRLFVKVPPVITPST